MSERRPRLEWLEVMGFATREAHVTDAFTLFANKKGFSMLLVETTNRASIEENEAAAEDALREICREALDKLGEPDA